MKIAVVTDSNSGITQAQAKEMGVAVLPMPFMIDGEKKNVYVWIIQGGGLFSKENILGSQEKWNLKVINFMYQKRLKIF